MELGACFEVQNKIKAFNTCRPDLEPKPEIGIDRKLTNSPQLCFNVVNFSYIQGGDLVKLLS